MADHQLELEGYSIVVLGSFNPAIFHPLWFSGNNLIRKEEEAAAKIEIIHNKIAIFSTEWFSLQVTDTQFYLQTEDPAKSLPMRDLALGTFKLLEHTPLTVFGFNRWRHFRMPSLESWHAFGHHFAPKESWKKILKDPGLRGMTIQGQHDNCEAAILVQIEPSQRVHPGLFINVNEHHDLNKDASLADRNRAFLTALQGMWNDFLGYSGHVSDHLFSESATPAKSPRRKRAR